MKLLRPLMLTVLYLGLRPRIATERADAGESRVDKIISLIGESRYSIHDVSRTKAKKAGEVSRFNLPLN